MAKKIESRTTTGHKMQLRSWLVELLMLRRHKKMLPSFFWREPKYKWQYTNEVKSVSKFIKKYGEHSVAIVIIENRQLDTALSYGELEFYLQNRQAKIEKFLSIKDKSSVAKIEKNKGVDKREPKIIKRKSRLFERLNQIEK